VPADALDLVDIVTTFRKRLILENTANFLVANVSCNSCSWISYSSVLVKNLALAVKQTSLRYVVALNNSSAAKVIVSIRN